MICTDDKSKWSAALQAMALDNPNIAVQINEWQYLKALDGKDYTSKAAWGLFRAHVYEITKWYDPGPEPPPEWYVKSCDGGAPITLDWKWLLLGLAVLIVIGQMRKSGVEYKPPASESLWEGKK